MARASDTATGRRRPGLPRGAGLALGSIALALLVGLDLLLDEATAAIVAAFVVAPLLTAAISGPLATAFVGMLAIAAALASPAWNMNAVGDADWIARAAVVFAGACFAVVIARLRVRSRGRVERLHLLDALGAVADGSLPLAETLRRVTDVIVPAVGDICVVDAVHDGRATRIATRARGRADAAEVEARLRTRRSSAPHWLVKVERPWRKVPRWLPRMDDEDLRRMASDPEDLAFLRSLGVRSSVSVPIRARDRNLGVLTLITAWSKRRYDADDVRFASILSGRIGLALDNAGLFSDLESVERRMDTVMSMVDEAIVIHGSDGELIYGNPAAAEMLGFPDPDEAVAPSSAAIRERFEIRDEHGREVGAEALAGRLTPDAVSRTPVTLRAIDRHTGRERWLRTKARAIEGSEGEPLYLVTAIEDVTDVKRAEFAQRLLARIGELLSHSEDYARTLEEVPQLLVPDFADGCSVNLLREDGTIEQVALFSPDPERSRVARELRRRNPIRVGDGSAMAHAINTGEPVLTTDDEELRRALSGEAERLEVFEQLGIGSTIVVPMSAAGHAVGALTFLNARGGRVFDEGDLELAVELARRAALALENARLAEERTRVAGALERELLPPNLPEMPGWEIATMYEPAGEVNRVGGDFYDVFRIDHGWAVVLGDVSGRGAAAASLTAEARHTIRTAGALAGNPSTGLRLLDSNLRARDDAALCSIAILVLSERPGMAPEIDIYLAGHPHPLLVRGESVETIGDPGPLLGVKAEARWDPVTVRLFPGDHIVLYTDGVVEAKIGARERFGVERLRRALNGCESPSGAVERVRAALESHRALAGDDDAALVAIRCSATAAAAEIGAAASLTGQRAR